MSILFYLIAVMFFIFGFRWLYQIVMDKKERDSDFTMKFTKLAIDLLIASGIFAIAGTLA